MKKLSSPFDLIKKALSLFSKKENLLYLIQIYLPLIPFSIISVVQHYAPNSIINLNSFWVTPVAAVLQILYLLTYVFVAASGIVAVGKVVEGGTLSVKSAFGSGWKKYWVFLLFSVIFFLIEVLGFVLLIIPGVLFLVWFAFSRFIIIKSDLGIKEALVASRQLAKGRFWKLLGRLIVFGAFTAVLEIILSIIPFGIGSILTALAGGLFILPIYLLFKEVSA